MPNTGVARAVQPPAADVCCFCSRPGDPRVPGELAVLLTAQQVPPRPTLVYHEACAGYSSAVAWGRKVGHKRVPYGAGEIPAKLVHTEWTRGARLSCTICGQPGATVCCKGIRECGVCWHLPCARQAAQDRQGVIFSATQREVACSKHAHSIVSCVKEPAGLWLQGCGGWDDQDQQVASSWWATRDLFESDGDSQGAGGQPLPALAALAGAAAAPTSPAASPAKAPASQGVQAEVVDLVEQEEEEEEEKKEGEEEEEEGEEEEVGQQPQQPVQAPPQLHRKSPEPPAAAARLRRITRKQSQSPLQQRRVRRQAGQVEEAQSPSRGGAVRVPDVVESEEEADEKAWRLPGHQWVLRGDICGPPPHRPCDLVVLNTVIPYRRQFRAVTRAYQHRMQDNPGQYPAVVASTSCCVPTEGDRAQVAKAIEAYIKRHAGIKGNGGRLTSPDQLPAVLPMAMCGERFPIPPDDPRTALATDVGALGWRNHNMARQGRRRGTARLPRLTVLGSYQSLQLKSEHYDDMMFDPELAEAMGLPQDQMVLSLEAYGADADLGSGIMNERGAGGKLLAAACDLFDKCDLHHRSKTFTHSAFGFGNETALINDVALDPIADVKAGREDLRQFRPPNCSFLECLVFGWPFMFVVTTRDVEPQEEFLLEYGQGYWSNVRKERERCRLNEGERQAQAQRMQEAQARLLELQRQQEQQLVAAASGLPTSGEHEAGVTQASGVAASDVGGQCALAAAADADPAAAARAAADEQQQIQQQDQQQQQQKSAPTAEAAAAVPGASQQGSPTSRAPSADAGEAVVATSPGPKPVRKPPASPAMAAGSWHRGSSKRGRSGSRSRGRGRSRSGSRSRGRSRSGSRSRRRSRSHSRDKAKRSRSHTRRSSPCRGRSRSRSRERRRSRTRSGSRGGRYQDRRRSDGGRGREEQRDSRRGRSRSGGRPRSRDRRAAPSSRQQQAEPALPPGFVGARQPAQPTQSGGSLPKQSYGKVAAPFQPLYPPPAQAHQHQQLQLPSYQPWQAHHHAPSRQPATGGWADSPPCQSMPPPADGSGTPDVDSDPGSQEQEARQEGGGTPDVLDDWEGPAAPAWQLLLRQQQQQLPAQQPWQQQPLVHPAVAAAERERSMTPDVDDGPEDIPGLPAGAAFGPGWAAPAYQHQQSVLQPQHQQWQHQAPPLQHHHLAAQRQQQQQQHYQQQQQQSAPQQQRYAQAPFRHQQQQQPNPQPWRQSQVAQQPARPLSPQKRPQLQQQLAQPHQQGQHSSMGSPRQPPGFNSRPQSRASHGNSGAAAAGRMPSERQQGQGPAGPGIGAGRVASAVRHVLLEPVPVGQSGHMLDRHAATARGLPCKDGRK